MKLKIKAVIFLDIDGTLIDSYRGSNLDKQKSFFNKFQEDGLKFVINSNRSIQDIVPITKQFGLNSIIIGENGAFIYSRSKMEPKIYLPKAEQEKMKQIKRLLPGYVREFFKTKSVNLRWVTTNTVTYLKQLDKHKFPEGSVVILNNKFRKFTVSAHVRLSRKGNLLPAKKYIQPLSKYISKKLSKYKVEVVGHPDFCNLLIHSAMISKKEGIKNLKKNYPNIDFYGIGDELGDYEMIKDDGIFFTTGNAKAQVKKLANYASSLPFTKGVVDIIQTQFYDTGKI